MAKRGRTVAQTAFTCQIVCGLNKRIHLMSDAIAALARRVCITEMRHECDLIDLGQRVQPRPSRPEGCWPQAQTVHA